MKIRIKFKEVEEIEELRECTGCEILVSVRTHICPWDSEQCNCCKSCTSDCERLIDRRLKI